MFYGLIRELGLFNPPFSQFRNNLVASSGSQTFVISQYAKILYASENIEEINKINTVIPILSLDRTILFDKLLGCLV